MPPIRAALLTKFLKVWLDLDATPFLFPAQSSSKKLLQIT